MRFEKMSAFKKYISDEANKNYHCFKSEINQKCDAAGQNMIFSARAVKMNR